MWSAVLLPGIKPICEGCIIFFCFMWFISLLIRIEQKNFPRELDIQIPRYNYYDLKIGVINPSHHDWGKIPVLMR